MNLSDLQTQFESSILKKPTGIVGTIVGDGRATPAERLSVYKNAYEVRLMEACEGDFSKTLDFLGVEKFKNYVREFIFSKPSTRASIDELSEDFYIFLKEKLGDQESLMLDIHLARVLNNPLDWVPKGDFLMNSNFYLIQDRWAVWSFNDEAFVEMVDGAEFEFLTVFKEAKSFEDILDGIGHFQEKTTEWIAKWTAWNVFRMKGN